jgi:hypothetical protein
MVPVFARAELAKILGGLWAHVGKELKLHAAHLLPANLHVKEDDGVLYFGLCVCPCKHKQKRPPPPKKKQIQPQSNVNRTRVCERRVGKEREEGECERQRTGRDDRVGLPALRLRFCC